MQPQTRQRCGEQLEAKQPCRDARRAISALLAKASATVDSFEPREVANLMWALATLGVEPGAELATAMSRRAVASAGEFKPQNVANLMWALAVFSGEDLACCSLWLDAISHLLPALRRKLVPFPGALTGTDVEVTHCSQLHQVLLCVVLEGLWPELDLAGLLGPDTVGLCRLAFEGGGVRSSTMQVRPGWSRGKGGFYFCMLCFILFLLVFA